MYFYISYILTYLFSRKTCLNTADTPFKNIRFVLCSAIVINGRIAQLVEQRARNRKVASSNPVKAYQTFHPSEVDKLVPVVVWPSGLRRGLSM